MDEERSDFIMRHTKSKKDKNELKRWGKAAQARLEELGMSRADLYHIVTGSKRHSGPIQRNLNGAGFPTKDRFFLICKILKMDPDEYPNAYLDSKPRGRPPKARPQIDLEAPDDYSDVIAKAKKAGTAVRGKQSDLVTVPRGTSIQSLIDEARDAIVDVENQLNTAKDALRKLQRFVIGE